MDSNPNENNEAHSPVLDTDIGPFGSSSGRYNWSDATDLILPDENQDQMDLQNEDESLINEVKDDDNNKDIKHVTVSKNRKTSGKIILLVLLAIIVLGVIFFMIFTFFKKQKKISKENEFKENENEE